MVDYEMIWRAAERNMIRRERVNRIKKGIITPEYGMKPQMMVKDATGRWCPKLEIHA